MKVLLSVLFSVLCVQAYTQIGINYRYHNLESQQWNDAKKSDLRLNSSFDLGIDYWFRLKNYRVEFLPEIYYSAYSTSKDNAKASNIGLQANTNFYIMDFEGDCDCPTFSKDGNFFTKGFFLSAGLGTEFQTKSIQESTENVLEASGMKFFAMPGAGVDFGITDLITLTPYFRYKFTFNQSWEGFNAFYGSEEADPSFINGTPQFGIRLGFRPDYVRGQRRFRRR